MQTGYVFLCNRAVMSECARNRRFSCSGKQVEAAQELKVNTIIFLFNDETGTLMGPFTVAQGPEDLVKGAWYSSVNERLFPETSKSTGKNCMNSKMPLKKYRSRNTNECALSVLQTQELLTEFKKAPSYSDEKQ